MNKKILITLIFFILIIIIPVYSLEFNPISIGEKIEISGLKFDTPNSKILNISYPNGYYTISSTTDFYFIGDIRDSREYGHLDSGREIIKSPNELKIIGKSIIDTSNYYQFGSNMFPNYIYYNTLDYSLNDSILNQIDVNTVIVNYTDNFDPTVENLTVGITKYFPYDNNASDVIDDTPVSTNDSVRKTDSGIISGSYSFGGTAYFYYDDDDDYSPTNSFTVNVWYYMNDTSNINPLIDKGFSTGHREFKLEGLDSSNYLLNLGTSTGAWGSTNTIAVAPKQKQWTMLTVTYNGARLKLFENGVGIFNVSYNQNVKNGDDYLRIGANGGGDGLLDYYLVGFVDEIGYWNTPLNDTQIEALYNSGVGLQYPFDDASADSTPPVLSTNFTSGVYNATEYNLCALATDKNDVTNGMIIVNGSVVYSTPIINNTYFCYNYDTIENTYIEWYAAANDTYDNIGYLYPLQNLTFNYTLTCIPNFVNSSLTDWFYIDECFVNNTRPKLRYAIEYDSNFCASGISEYNVSQYYIEFGTPSGSYTAVNTKDNVYWNISEVVDSPGFLFYYNFTSVVGDINNINLYGQYHGNPAHIVYFQLLNNSGYWINLTQIIESDMLLWHNFSISGSNYRNGTKVRARIIHYSPGVISHKMSLDYVDLLSRANVTYEQYSFDYCVYGAVDFKIKSPVYGEVYPNLIVPLEVDINTTVFNCSYKINNFITTKYNCSSINITGKTGKNKLEICVEEAPTIEKCKTIDYYSDNPNMSIPDLIILLLLVIGPVIFAYTYGNKLAPVGALGGLLSIIGSIHIFPVNPLLGSLGLALGITAIIVYGIISFIKS